jgi:hypothetical protein
MHLLRDLCDGSEEREGRDGEGDRIHMDDGLGQNGEIWAVGKGERHTPPTVFEYLETTLGTEKKRQGQMENQRYREFSCDRFRTILTVAETSACHKLVTPYN